MEHRLHNSIGKGAETVSEKALKKFSGFKSFKFNGLSNSIKIRHGLSCISSRSQNVPPGGREQQASSTH
jgi:hypothetical protein